MTREELIDWAKTPETQQFINILANIRLNCLSNIASSCFEDKPEFKRQMAICTGLEYVVKNLIDLGGATPHNSQFYPNS